MKTTAILMLPLALCLVGCRPTPSPPLPTDSPSAIAISADAPSRWWLTVRVYPTAGPPPDPFHGFVSVHTSGQIPGHIAARPRRSVTKPNTVDDFRKELTQAEMDKLYSLARLAIQRHMIGGEPESTGADGGSLSILLRAYDRSVEVAYHHNAILESEARALLAELDAHLPPKYRTQWISRDDIRRARRRRKAEP